MPLKHHDQIRAELMEATWLATVACCTALHDIGFESETIADVLPQAQADLAKVIVERCVVVGRVTKPILPGDAIKDGQGYAERIAAQRAGRVA